MRSRCVLESVSANVALGAGVTVSNQQLIVIVVSVTLMVLLRLLVMHTRVGKAMQAVSHSHTAASLMGISVDRIITFTFLIGSALAAAAGVLVALQTPKIEPLMGIMPGLKAFVAAVLGGIGNIPGAMLGGVLLGLVEALGAGYIGEFTDLCQWGLPLAACADGGHFILMGSNYQDVFAFIVLILVLVFRPQGLLGERVGDRA